MADFKLGPLAGTRIVEFAGIGPGPFASMILSDLQDKVYIDNIPSEVHTKRVTLLNRVRNRVLAEL